MLSIGYILLAVLVISFLIFIHELGHYFMARRTGMRVETFSIGFGRPIVSWKWNNESWQIGWLLFGGYVKIAGMDEEPDRDPYQVADGFFGRPPLDRIKVAVMGPLVNILFALFIFSFLWVDNGREKNFTEFTHKIGAVDSKSELYAQGVRPGDEIVSYNDYPFQAAMDHLYAPMVSGDSLVVQGNHVNYKTGVRTPFSVKVAPYQHPLALEKGRMTSGILAPASYIIYDRMPDGTDNPLIEGSPLADSGIEYGDRIVWVDGEPIFSVQELNQIINDGRALLTIDRGGKTLLRRTPRIRVQELRFDNAFQEELADWQFEALLKGVKLRDLYMIPYDLTNAGVVQSQIKFLDPEAEDEAFPKNRFSDLEEPLLPGDKIIAIEGKPVAHSYEILSQLQENRINIIVERDSKALEKISWLEADHDFDRQMDWTKLEEIASQIGTQHATAKAGDYVLLKSIAPKMLSQFNLPEDKQTLVSAQFEQQRKQIEEIEDPEKRVQALHVLEEQEKKLLIGLPNTQDRHVEYNPIPTDLFVSVFTEIRRTLSALVSGSLSPKWISGPVGIIQVVHASSLVNWKETLFWVGAISLNLGVLNLLPLPMLDGGIIVFNTIELITRKRIPPKLIEKIIIPFAVIMATFFIFLTYNDLSRLLGGFFK